jgi:pre-mRNA 3'-end-processing factor FIP1
MFADPTQAQAIPQAPRAPSAVARGGRATPVGPAARGGRGAIVPTRSGRPPPTGPAAGRSASPLPPNVPTGPRNANKYKDRDNNGPAVDGLDYGNSGASSGRGSGEPESRKRRGSPSVDDRSSKTTRR